MKGEAVSYSIKSRCIPNVQNIIYFAPVLAISPVNQLIYLEKMLLTNMKIKNLLLFKYLSWFGKNLFCEATTLDKGVFLTSTDVISVRLLFSLVEEYLQSISIDLRSIINLIIFFLRTFRQITDEILFLRFF